MQHKHSLDTDYVMVNYNVTQFNSNLNFVTWDEIFDDYDVNSMFNYFLNTFYTSFILFFLKLRKQILLKSVSDG